MVYRIAVEQEADGRWIGEVREVPGCLAYGRTREDAAALAQALALHVFADRIEHGELVEVPAELRFELEAQAAA